MEKPVEFSHKQAINVSHYVTDYITKACDTVASLAKALALGVRDLEMNKPGWKTSPGLPASDAPPSANPSTAVDAYASKRFSPAEKGSDEKKQTWDASIAYAVKCLARLQSSLHNTWMKKLTETNFQLMYNHECYGSHSLWTLYAKRAVSYGYRAKELKRLRFTGEAEDLSDYRVPVGCTEGLEDYAAADNDEDPIEHVRVC